MHIISLGASTLALLAHLTSAAPRNASPQDAHHNSLPVVDLGYVKQRASALNATGKYYNFTNIAYAQPPLGPLRFTAPQPPKHIASIQDGNDKPERECSQAYPIWASEVFNNVSFVPKNYAEDEDCLYLDVLVPQKIYDNKAKPGWSGKKSKGAPVLVWIHGGGYVFGSKIQNGGGSGLIARSTDDEGDEGVIFVAMNYRLGAYGWLGGTNFQKEGGSSNAGLLDQRLALEWVQQNIHKFGGDPGRVTAIGESGGAASIGQHLVAGTHGHEFCEKKTPFQKAIFQSPDEGPPQVAPDATFNTIFHDFLNELKVSTLKQAQSLSSDAVYNANKNTVMAYPAGQFPTFGLSIDGSYVVGNINQGLNAGRYDRNIQLMTSYNADEGALFTVSLDPSPANSSSGFSFPAYVKSVLPSASQSTIDHISNDLYPLSAYSGSEYARTDVFNAEVFIVCSTYALQKAYSNKGYAYEFSVPPAWHTQDIESTLFNGHNPPGLPIDPDVAVDMQTWITNFAMYGNPNEKLRSGLKGLPVFGSQGNMLNLTESGYDVVSEPERAERCKFWEKYSV